MTGKEARNHICAILCNLCQRAGKQPCEISHTECKPHIQAMKRIDELDLAVEVPAFLPEVFFAYDTSLVQAMGLQGFTRKQYMAQKTRAAQAVLLEHGWRKVDLLPKEGEEK